MKISLKNRPLAYFSNNPGIAVAFIFIAMIFLVIVGASQKEVFILDDSMKMAVVAYNGDVRDVLEQNKVELNPKDKVSPGLASIVKDGTEIFIKRAVPVTVDVDGSKIQLQSAENTVGDVLATEGITYGKIDKVIPGTDAPVTKDMNIKIVRVVEQEIVETEKLAYTNEIKEMPEWEKGVDKTLRAGSDGVKESTIKITYEDGVETNREVVAEKVVKSPVSSQVAVGTLDWRPISRGETIQFAKMIIMKATSYTDDIACTGQTGGTTFSGTKPRRYSDGSRWSTVAVDPKVIPLGTKLWIEGYGYAIAEDIGGAVKGNIIDLFFTNGTQEYLDWSTHRTRVYILK